MIEYTPPGDEGRAGVKFFVLILAAGELGTDQVPGQIDDGRRCLVLRAPLDLPFPVRLLQGTADTAVSVATAVALLDHATSPDMRLTIVKDADHRFSDDTCLGLIKAAVEEVSG